MDFNSVKSTMNRFHNIFRGALAAIVVLSMFAFGGIAVAQTDLDGSDLVINAAGPWDAAYTNTNTGVTSYIIIGPLNSGTRYTYSGALTGNIHVDVTHQTHTNNDNRFTISNANNTFTGGLAMHGGILFVNNSNQLVSFSGGLTLDNAVFMAYGDCNFDVTIPAGSFGGMRASGGGIVLNQKVTGGGDLVIVTENNNVVTMKGANDYTGVTSIGTIQGGTNLYAYLDLGADYTLPSTTVVEIGKSQNPNYSFTGASASRLNLAGTTQTIAGLYGAGKASITNGTAAVANLTIDLADGASYEYSGTIAGNSATNVTNLTVTGAGNQTLSGNISNASLTKSGSGTLTLSADSVGLTSLTVSDGTLAITPNVTMTVAGKITIPDSTLDLNGANLTYTSNVSGDFSSLNITNTNEETQSVLTIAPTADVTQQTFDKKVSGNTRLVVHLKTNQNNDSRLMITNTSSDYTGGLFIEQGTARVDDYGALGTSKQIDMKHGSLMTKLSYEGYTINLVGDASKGERGAIRFSGSSTGNLDAYITGVGSLEIVYDGSITLTNQANDYQGKTYIGNFQWRSTNTSGDATLNLGASGVLPDSTEVVFGKNAEGNGTSGNIKLDLKGYNETVAGISGDSTKGVITSDTPATLTLVGNGDYTFAGKVTGSATVEKQGTGTLTISGANTGALVVSEGTLVLSGDNTGAQSITVKEGGTLVPKTEASMATTVNLQTTAFAYPDNKFTKNTKFVISESGTVISVPMTDLQSGTHVQYG
ncbi:MAG: autotransporter-associated beta strand repeat-containing protein [Thermoguttaceae bacterium]|nr:autotransporter-associated beta strand repeat-containing protein [Thermoguttaceae bacterium]